MEQATRSKPVNSDVAAARGQKAILWLCSWYPHPGDLFHGDFIQRHARAVSLYVPVHVLHIPLLGPFVETSFFEQKIEQEGVHEWIRGLDYKPGHSTWVNKVNYNLLYQKAWEQLLEEYVHVAGEPALVHVHVAMKAGIAALQFCKKRKIPYIVSEQASLYDTQGLDQWNTRSWHFRWHTARIMRGAAAITNVSKRLALRIEALCQVDSVQVIHNTVDTRLFRLGEKPNTFRWLHASSLSEQKRPEDMIRAFGMMASRLKGDWELVICGPLKPELQALAREVGIENRVHWKGMVSYAEVAAEMRKSTAFVLFSWHENFPCVVVEALCCGLPVLASAVGGISEAVDETNGMIIQPESDVEALSQHLLEWSDRIGFFDRTRIAENAGQRYSYSNIGKDFIQLYQKVLADCESTSLKHST